MPFTNNDLKQLKESLKKQDEYYFFHLGSDRIAALIARLEALEKVRKTAAALKSAAWTKSIQQLMYGDSTILRKYNKAVSAYEKRR